LYLIVVLMINYPIYLSLMTAMGITLYFLFRFIGKKYHLLKNGFRTQATVIEVVEHRSGRMTELGYVPIVRFKAKNGNMVVYKTDFFLERFVTNIKLEVGYQFDIIYEGNDLKSMMEYSTLKGVVITYVVVALFPGLLFLGLLTGLFF